MGQHKFSGYPGAYCLLCGTEDAVENALAMNWLDPVTGDFDTEEHKKEVIEAHNNCPYTKDGQNPYEVNVPVT